MSDGAAEIAAGAAEEQLHFRRSISKDPSSSWWKNSAVGQFRRSFSASAKEFSSTLASKMDLAGFTLPWHQQAAGSLHHHKQQQQQPKVDDRLPSSSSFNLLPRKYAAASATTKDQRKSFELPKPTTVVQEQQQLHSIPSVPLKSGMIRSSSKVAEFCRTKKQTLAQDTTAAVSCKTKQMLMKDAAAVESATTLSSLDADIKHVNEASLILSEAHGSLINNSTLAQALPCPLVDNSSVVDVTGSSCSGQQEAAEHEVKKSTTTQHDDSTNNFFLESSAIQNMGDNILSGDPTHCTQLLPTQLQKSSSTSSDYRSHSHRKTLANSLLFDESQYNSSSSFDANSLSKNHHVLVGGSMRVVRDFNSYDDAQLEFITSDHPTAGPPTSLPTSPRRRRAGSGIRTSSSWLQRLRLVAGGKQQGSASSSSSHQEGIGQTVIGSDNSNSGKQDATTTPVVVAAAAAAEERLDLRHGKKKEVSNSAPKAAHDCVTTDESTVVDDDLVHQQHEAGDGNKVEIAEGNHEEEHHSFQTHEEQCCSTTSDSTKDFVAKPPEQQKLNRSSWPFSKWKWSSRSHSKVVSEEEEEEEEVENGNNDKMVKEVNFVVDCKSGGGGGESKLVKQTKMRSSSMECLETEEELQMPPTLLLRSEQNNLTIEEVVALSSSPLKFMFKCREIQHFNKFLRLQKKRLTSSLQQHNQEQQQQQQHPAESTDCFHIIRSGTQSEVSSMVSALLMAWLMENNASPPPVRAAENWHLVPVVNIARQSMHNHKDAAWLFDACGVDAHALLFADEVEWEKLTKAGRIKIEDIGQDLLVTTNKVGSVCTLLGEQLQKEAHSLLQLRYMKTLLLAGILLDTKNLDLASKRDIDMATTLLVGSGSLGRNGFYKQLREVESEEKVSKLVTDIYGNASQLSRQSGGEEPEPVHSERSEKDLYFSSTDGHHSNEQTSTSEAGTHSSSLDVEDSLQLQTPPPVPTTTFLPTKIIAAPLSVLARFHLPSPSGLRSTEANADKAQKQQAPGANQSLPSSSSQHLKSKSFSKIRKMVLYSA
ncbi:unnamed protein product [Sphagnum tenellum]